MKQDKNAGKMPLRNLYHVPKMCFYHQQQTLSKGLTVGPRTEPFFYNLPTIYHNEYYSSGFIIVIVAAQKTHTHI
jgi:hypothetical protein